MRRTLAVLAFSLVFPAHAFSQPCANFTVFMIPRPVVAAVREPFTVWTSMSAVRASDVMLPFTVRARTRTPSGTRIVKATATSLPRRSSTDMVPSRRHRAPG